jgi:hypothetical protein
MGLPPRFAYPLYEVALRWGCTITDLAEWATMGQFDLVTGIPRICSDGKPVAGMVALNAADMLPMFRRDGSGPSEIRVYRVRQLDAPRDDWLFISEPEDGIIVHRADILITAADVAQFEETHELSRKPSSAAPTSKYDWDAFYVAVIKRIYEHGLPDTQAEFVAEFQEWFSRRDPNGEMPDERTVRRRINPIWRALRDSQAT